MARIPCSALLLCATACTTVERGPAPAAAAVPGAPPDSGEAQRLRALFADSDAAMLRRNPIAALGRGDLSNAHELGNAFSDEYVAGERMAAETDLAALRQIDRARLNATDRLAL
jgi:hypothetical protein